MKGTSPSRGCGGSRESASKCHDGVSSLHQRQQEGKSMSIVTVGIDLAKNVFAIHGVDETGKAVLVRPKVTRDQLVALIAQLPPCLIGMEACSGAHHWARVFQLHGHTVRLMAARLVAPYRMSGKHGKNDVADAAAICEAVTRPVQPASHHRWQCLFPYRVAIFRVMRDGILRHLYLECELLLPSRTNYSDDMHPRCQCQRKRPVGETMNSWSIHRLQSCDRSRLTYQLVPPLAWMRAGGC